MTFPSLKKSTWISSLSDIPLHMRISFAAALISLVVFFLPSLTLTLFSASRMNLSYFQILQSGQMRLSISDAKYLLSFSGAVPFLVFSLILPVLVMLLAIFYRVIAGKIPGRAISAAALVLTLGNLAALFFVPSQLVPSSFLS